MLHRDKFRLNRILVKLGLSIITLGVTGSVLISFKILPEQILLPPLFLLTFCGSGLIGWFGSTLCYDERPFWTPVKEDLLGLFVDLWAVPDNIEKLIHIDIIAPLSYGSLPNDLTQATRNHLLKAIELWQRLPKAKIVFGNASNCFPGSELVEKELKREILAKNEIPENIFLQGDIKNTVTEAWNARNISEKAGIGHTVIVVITGLIHSRSARYIWRKVFPNSKIFIYCPPDDIETQPDQIIILLQSPWRWVFANIARQVFLRVLGLERTSQFTHPTE